MKPAAVGTEQPPPPGGRPAPVLPAHTHPPGGLRSSAQGLAGAEGLWAGPGAAAKPFDFCNTPAGPCMPRQRKASTRQPGSLRHLSNKPRPLSGPHGSACVSRSPALRRARPLAPGSPRAGRRSGPGCAAASWWRSSRRRWLCRAEMVAACRAADCSAGKVARRLQRWRRAAAGRATWPAQCGPLPVLDQEPAHLTSPLCTSCSMATQVTCGAGSSSSRAGRLMSRLASAPGGVTTPRVAAGAGPARRAPLLSFLPSSCPTHLQRRFQLRAALLARPGPVDEEEVEVLQAQAAQRLPAAQRSSAWMHGMRSWLVGPRQPALPAAS